MSAPPPAAPGLLEKVSRLLPRVLLGVFVLGQAVFLLAHNVVDMKSEAHEYLTRERDKFYKHVREEAALRGWAVLSAGQAREELFEKPAPESSFPWRMVHLSPAVEESVAEWLDAGQGEARDRTTIGAAYAWVDKRTTWWARKAKQEPQSWSLFAPYVADWMCFPSLELVWDEGKGGEPRSVTLLSDNEPRNINRFVRFGNFRLRRYEALFDVRPVPVEEEGAEPTPEQKDELGDRMARVVRDRYGNMLAYMRWRVRRYREGHPGVPRPTEVILHTRGWIIPPPPEEPSWTWRFPGWRFAGDYPLARWQPGKDPDKKCYPVEVYVPRHAHFKKLERP